MRTARHVLGRTAAIPLSTTFHYEIANLTSYGGDTGFPIRTAATLYDLRLRHKSHSGATVEIPLYDDNGVRQVDLDTNTLFLRSDEITLPDFENPIELQLYGRVRPTELNVGIDGKEVRIDATAAFALEVRLVPGLYEVVYLSDCGGARYAVGTICLCHHDAALDDAFPALRRAARSCPLRTGHVGRRHRIGSR